MPRNAIFIDHDGVEFGIGNLPDWDPFGFMRPDSRHTQTDTTQAGKRPQQPGTRTRRSSTRPRHEIDRIRDEVNEWMEDAQFGVAGVPDVAPAPPDEANATVDADMPLNAQGDTYDYVEKLLASGAADVEMPDATEPMPPDPVAESIFLDDTEELRHDPQDLGLSDFQNALGLWVTLHNISRAAYSHLVEVFQLANSIDDVRMVSRRKDTLKARVRKSLPLGKLRRSTVNLDMSRLPTRSLPTEKVLTTDLEDTLATLISSRRVYQQIYRGMAHKISTRVRNPWEAPWWGESVRTSSGKFHRYADGGPIFPSDFVIWRCEPGVTDHLPDRCNSSCKRTHIGRVLWSGLDMTSVPGADARLGTPRLLVQRVYQRGGYIPFHLITLTAMMSQSPTAPEAQELMIVEDGILSMHPDSIIRHIPDVCLDYKFSSKDPLLRQKPCIAPFTVRYIWKESQMAVRELRYSSPHRAELELQALGRAYVVDNFANADMVSLPLHMFVDAFGLYRNMYRSIEGIYFIPQFFDTAIRNRRSSVITATLGPYGANRADVLQTLAHTNRLDRGTRLTVNGKEVFVCSFVAAIIGDMPSQQELSGCLGPKANFPCRYCLVAAEEKGDMSFDVHKMGKYHRQVIDDRARIISQTRAPTTRRTKLAGLGLSDNEKLFSTLRSLFPALDIIRSRPIDAAHSEYAGMSKYLHKLIFQEATSLLTRAAIQQAAEVFHHFPTPPGWPHFQSPRTHLDSYSIQDYARGIIVLPIFLRCWLRDHHIKPELHKYLRSRAKDYLDDPAMTDTTKTAVDTLVTAVWTVTRSVLTTCGRTKAANTMEDVTINTVHGQVVAGRKAFQFLCQVQSDALQSKASARATTSNQTAPSAAGRAPSEAAFTQLTIARTIPSTIRRRADPEDRINQFLRWKQVPNVHAGLHIAEVAREYGNCTMVFTLIGEDMHKQYKALIYSTNHSNAAATLVNINNHMKTVAFLLAGCYEKQYPMLHRTYQSLRNRCPQFARALDPYLGREENNDDDYDYDDVDDDKSGTDHLDITSDPNHKQPRVFKPVPRRVVHASRDPLVNVVTPTEMINSHEFLKMLRKSSFEDYGTYMVEPGGTPLRWWQKIVFTTP
ncbi:hypothetical protein F4861DRAFT_534789 [Xylaria intraflava]|nr:hypothetical protein F4861DRAFT_534789 [Xylaria intraflava]